MRGVLRHKPPPTFCERLITKRLKIGRRKDKRVWPYARKSALDVYRGVGVVVVTLLDDSFVYRPRPFVVMSMPSELKVDAVTLAETLQDAGGRDDG